MLAQKGVLSDREAAKLQSLAKDAANKLKALDRLSGAELARALMMDKTDRLVWRKGFFSMSDTAKAVKAAVEAQEALSQALGEFIGRLLATNNKSIARLRRTSWNSSSRPTAAPRKSIPSQ